MNDAAAPLVLNANEVRVLGCLIEKEATTPDTYPLTVNAVQVAANQKTSRDPVMNLSLGDANHALRQLETKGLAKQVFSSRAERYEHRTGAYFGVPQQQVILLGLLALRGMQTAFELLARSERLFKFNDVEDVRHHLERLMQRQQALVVQIPRGAGQREDRYMHTLAGEVDVAAMAARVPSASSAAAPASAELESRVASLEAEVAALREMVQALQAANGSVGALTATQQEQAADADANQSNDQA